MSFGTLSTTSNGAQTWTEAGLGRYVLSTAAFGSPLEYFKFTGGRLGKDGRVSATAQHGFEQDIDHNGSIVRDRQLITTNFLVPSLGFTKTHVDVRLALINEVLTEAFLDRLLKGEQ